MKLACLISITLVLTSGCYHHSNTRLAAKSYSHYRDTDWSGFLRLSGFQIKRAFSDVVDNATVVDGAGGKAVNYWYKEGRFSSNWEVGTKSGRLSGAWNIENDERCVTFDMAIDDRLVREKRCSPIYFKEGKYFSVNKAGQLHGIHILTKQ